MSGIEIIGLIIGSIILIIVSINHFSSLEKRERERALTQNRLDEVVADFHFVNEIIDQYIDFFREKKPKVKGRNKGRHKTNQSYSVPIVAKRNKIKTPNQLFLGINPSVALAC